MEKITLVLGIEDRNYQDHMIHYIRNSEFSNHFIIKSFSSSSSLAEFLRLSEPFHILLAEPNMVSLEPLERGMLVLLTESSQEDFPHPCVSKYQPLNQLLGSVQKLYIGSNPAAGKQISGGRTTKIISFWSAMGGVGKTTASLAAAGRLGRSGQVLFISLETICGIPSFNQARGEGGFSEVLYFVQNQNKAAVAKLEALKKRDDHLSIDFLPPPAIIDDLLETGREDIKKLLLTIAEAGIYDYIVVDMEASLHARMLGALEVSDAVYCMVVDDIQCIQKTNNLIDAMQMGEYQGVLSPGKVYFTVNKYMGTMLNQSERFDFRLFLPYIPSWKTATSVHVYGEEPVFGKHIQELLDSTLTEQ